VDLSSVCGHPHHALRVQERMLHLDPSHHSPEKRNVSLKLCRHCASEMDQCDQLRLGYCFVCKLGGGTPIEVECLSCNRNHCVLCEPCTLCIVCDRVLCFSTAPVNTSEDLERNLFCIECMTSSVCADCINYSSESQLWQRCSSCRHQVCPSCTKLGLHSVRLCTLNGKRKQFWLKMRAKQENFED
jgi:hypothetical protein